MILVDSHCHLDFPEYASDLTETKQRARQAGVKFLISVGTTLGQSKRNITLAQNDKNLFAAVGIHPHEADRVANLIPSSLASLRQLAASERVVAIGETGLDYYKSRSLPGNQKKLFRDQVNLALEIKKPLILHIRDAYRDALAILEKEYLPFCSLDFPGVAHSFGAGLWYARRFWERGFFIGINGIVTFSNAAALREIVSQIPLKSLLLETDAPFLAPEPFRGQRNEPAYIVEIARKVAEIKGLPVAKVAQIITRNSKVLFGF